MSKSMSMLQVYTIGFVLLEKRARCM
jgi:hypothetical protein